MADTKKAGGKRKTSPLNETVLRLTEGLSPKAANLIIEAYSEMPYVVRDALDDYYKAKEGLDGKDGMEAVKRSLEQLKQACEANEEYMELYQTAKTDANQEIAEMYANGGISV